MVLRLAWITPLGPRSDVGAFSRAILTAARRDHAGRVEMLPIVQENGPSYFLEGPWLRLDERFDPDLLSAFDHPCYNLGNNVENHGRIARLALDPAGVVILHDVVMHPFLACLAFEAGAGAAPYAALVAATHGAEGLAVVTRSGVLADPPRPAVLPWQTAHVDALPLVAPFVASAAAVVVHSAYAEQRIRPLTRAPILALGLPHDQKPAPSAAEIAAWEAATRRADRPLAVAFGHIARNKCLDLVLRALARTPPGLRLLIAGRPAEPGLVEELQGLATRLGLGGRVVFECDVPPARLEEIKRAADLFLNLRHPNTEGASGSLVEMLAAGKPVVVHPSGCFAELPAGATVPVRDLADPAELAGVLTALAADARTADRGGASRAGGGAALVGRSVCGAAARLPWRGRAGDPPPPGRAWRAAGGHPRRARRARSGGCCLGLRCGPRPTASHPPARAGSHPRSRSRPAAAGAAGARRRPRRRVRAAGGSRSRRRPRCAAGPARSPRRLPGGDAGRGAAALGRGRPPPSSPAERPPSRRRCSCSLRSRPRHWRQGWWRICSAGCPRGRRSRRWRPRLPAERGQRRSQRGCWPMKRRGGAACRPRRGTRWCIWPPACAAPGRMGWRRHLLLAEEAPLAPGRGLEAALRGPYAAVEVEGAWSLAPSAGLAFRLSPAVGLVRRVAVELELAPTPRRRGADPRLRRAPPPGCPLLPTGRPVRLELPLPADSRAEAGVRLHLDAGRRRAGGAGDPDPRPGPAGRGRARAAAMPAARAADRLHPRGAAGRRPPGRPMVRAGAGRRLVARAGRAAARPLAGGGGVAAARAAGRRHGGAGSEAAGSARQRPACWPRPRCPIRRRGVWPLSLAALPPAEEGRLTLELDCGVAANLAALGLGQDSRELGVMLIALTATAEAPA